MSDVLTGAEVIEQANDDSILNTEPAAVRGIVVGAAGGVTMLLVVFGVMGEEQRQPIILAVGETAFWGFTAVVTIVPIVQGLWTRLRTYSPKTAAEVAVENYELGKASTQELATPYATSGPTLPL
jgi:hypothetical protein